MNLENRGWMYHLQSLNVESTLCRASLNPLAPFHPSIPISSESKHHRPKNSQSRCQWLLSPLQLAQCCVPVYGSACLHLKPHPYYRNNVARPILFKGLAANTTERHPSPVLSPTMRNRQLRYPASRLIWARKGKRRIKRSNTSWSGQWDCCQQLGRRPRYKVGLLRYS